jgi:hypothetical protein
MNHQRKIERENTRREIMGNGLIGIVVAAAIWIALFLIFRAIVLWYWRVNEGIALLKSIDQKLNRIAGNTPESDGRTSVDPFRLKVCFARTPTGISMCKDVNTCFLD